MIQGIADVFYFVQDMDRAVAFYADIVGLGAPSFASTHWTEWQLSGTKFGLHWSEGNPVTNVRDAHGSTGGATVTFLVADIDAAVDALKARGVEFLGGISRDPWGSLATMVDPDGNVVKLKQS